MKNTISQVLKKIKEDFIDDNVFINARQFSAVLNDVRIETDEKKVRHLLKVAIREMQVYSRLKAESSNNDFIIDNLAAEMSSDYMIDKDAAQTVIECFAELLECVPVAPEEEQIQDETINNDVTSNCALCSQTPSTPPTVQSTGNLFITSQPELAYRKLGYDSFMEEEEVAVIGYGRLTSETLKIPQNVEGHSVVEIGAGAFTSYGEDIDTIYIPEGVYKIGHMAFGHLSQLTKIVLPESIKYIEDEAFFYCSKLTSINIPNKIERIGNRAFWNCESLENISLPDSLSHIGTEAFRGCKKIETIELPYSLGRFFHNYTGVFDWCIELKSVIIPNNYKCIPEKTFSLCKSLKSITIPEGVEYIGESAFLGCESLERIVLPRSLKEIRPLAFANCKNLTNISMPNDSKVEIAESAFGGCKKLDDSSRKLLGNALPLRYFFW